MRKVMRLVNVQLWAVLSDMLYLGKTNKKKPKAMYVGVVMFTLFMCAISGFYSFMIGTGLKMFQSLDILPALMMAVVCVIIIFTTVFKVKGTIFGFRDYDMIMSLPVSTGVVVATRLIILYALNFMFVVMLMVPMMIAYGILAKPDILFYVFGLISILIIPLVPIVVASVLGTIIAYAASKFKHNNFFNIILSLGLISIIIGLSFTIRGDGQQLVDAGKAITNQVNSIYPLAQMYMDAVVHYDMTAFLTFIAISLLAFFLYSYIVKISFKRINTLIMTGRSRSNYKMGELKASSPFKALYIKEMKRYFSSTVYVLNTGIGIVLLTIGAVALLFVDPGKILGSQGAPADMVNNYIPLYVTFCIIMTCTTMASISLEGKNLWIIKSMPISSKTVYFSKIAVNLTVLAPAVIDTLIVGIALKFGLPELVLMLLVSAACSIFIAFYGLLINLLFPNFNWTAEVIVVKQSVACMITIFSGIAYVGVQFLFLFLLHSFTFGYLAYFLLTIILDAVLYLMITTYGKKRYITL